MEHWQFLIQKQGDRAWQSLESPTLKILAGKYRVLARSHLPNTDVEVRVTHSSIQEVPPKRRIFKRVRRTNADGLMAVIPFTDLKLGIWELRCSGDLMTDMLGKPWQYSLLIKVLPQEEFSDQLKLGSGNQFDNELEILLPEEDQFAIIPPSIIDINGLLTETEEDIIINQPVSPVWFKGESAEQLLQNLIDLALSPDSLEEEEADDNFRPVSPPSLLKLSLERDSYIGRWGKTLTVNGEVELAETENLEDEILSATSVCQLQLVIELRSPLESKILTQVKQPLTDKILPFTFSSAIDIPIECESKLILADINLYGALTDEAEVLLLGSNSFIITADVTELLTITLPKSQPPDLLSPSNQPPNQAAATQPEEPIEVDLELFNLVKTPKLAQFHLLKPSAKKHLPPRIKPVVVLDGLSPELPKLPRIHKNAVAESLISEEVVKKPSQISPINLEKLVIKQIKTTFPYLKRLIPAPNQEEEATGNLPDTLSEIEISPQFAPNHSQVEDDSGQEFPEDTEELITADTPKTSPLIKKWMQSQGYFLPEGMELVYQDDHTHESKEEPALTLNAENPPVDVELSLNLDREIDVEEDNVAENLFIDTSEPALELEEVTPPIQISTWVSHEIVLDDTHISLSKENNNPSLEPLVDLSSPVVVSLPTPQLFLPNGELLAGTSIKVRLELSEVSSSAVVVKLWIEDYQTRGLLDGPHLLKDLRPTPWGNWEVMTHLIVPLGCLEILVGAIALDLTTQQESGKVTVLKTVIPPDLPMMELDQMLGM